MPGRERKMYEVNGVPSFIDNGHPGRDPEAVRRGAGPGAAGMIHPRQVGNEIDRVTAESFGAASSPSSEKAVMCSALVHEGTSTGKESESRTRATCGASRESGRSFTLRPCRRPEFRAGRRHDSGRRAAPMSVIPIRVLGFLPTKSFAIRTNPALSRVVRCAPRFPSVAPVITRNLLNSSFSRRGRAFSADMILSRVDWWMVSSGALTARSSSTGPRGSACRPRRRERRSARAPVRAGRTPRRRRPAPRPPPHICRRSSIRRPRRPRRGAG